MSNSRRTLPKNIELDCSSNKLFFEDNKLQWGILCACPTKPEGYWQIGPSNKDSKVLPLKRGNSLLNPTISAGYLVRYPQQATFEENKLQRGNLYADPTKPEGYWQIDPSNKDNKVYHCNGVNPCSIRPFRRGIHKEYPQTA